MSATAVPYQTYKSKRHSRVLSNTATATAAAGSSAEANGNGIAAASPSFAARHTPSPSLDVNPWGTESTAKSNASTKRMSFPGFGAPQAAPGTNSVDTNGWNVSSASGSNSTDVETLYDSSRSRTSSSASAAMLKNGFVNGNADGNVTQFDSESSHQLVDGDYIHKNGSFQQTSTYSRAPSSSFRSVSAGSSASTNGIDKGNAAGTFDSGPSSPVSSRSRAASTTAPTSTIPSISLEAEPYPAPMPIPTPTVVLSPSAESSTPASSPLDLSLSFTSSTSSTSPTATASTSDAGPSLSVPTSPTLSVSPSLASTSSAASTTGPSKPGFNSRRSSTFRHVPLRPPSSSNAPRTSSPLRPPGPAAQGHHARALSAAFSSSPLAGQPLTAHPQPQRSASVTNASVRPSHDTQAQIRENVVEQGSSASGSMLNSGLKADSPVLRAAVLANAHQRTSSANVGISAPTGLILPPQRTSSLPTAPPVPPQKAISPSPTLTPISSSVSSSVTSPRILSPSPQATPSSSTASSGSAGTYRASSAYRPGFQPKGVYRPRTDEFLAARANVQDRDRVERTRLERRFEKLVDLHFPASPLAASGGGGNDVKAEGVSVKGKEKVALSSPMRRASTLFERIDFNDLRTKSASELWKGVLESRANAANGGKGDVRAAEQRITPWQDDADVSACPHCSASFHPLTNRKHHCRLCGRIICSLPVKRPQRPTPCSLLFIADPKSGRIEEVSETVDYGVRPRSPSTGNGTGKGTSAEERMLKGVRICRECKPVMLRQQYRQEAKRSPLIVRLYEAFISLETEIEEALPQFQELMLNLSNNPDEAPTKEASAIRKHLLQCFGDYDAIAKRIARIPCPGPGSSQERVQSAIIARANMFLQKNMFPLQSLPRPKRRIAGSGSEQGQSKTAKSGEEDDPASGGNAIIDPDSELARALQPLLEQEALLESFVDEARAHRKFEDLQTLKGNLGEIRAEIDKIVGRAEANASAGR